MNKNTPILRKNLDEGVLGEANIDGSIFIDKSVKKGSQQEKDIIAHESFHTKQMKSGLLSYDDNSITYKGKKYERKDGAIKYNGKFYKEGSEMFPWEQDANEAITSDYFKDYDYSELKKVKPPNSNSYDCMLEVKALNKIPLNKDFVKKHDDIEQAFKDLISKKKIKDYDETIAAELIKKSAPIILDLKNYFNRSRPKDMAVKMNISMQDIEMDSMKTMSYPSGHSAQAFLIAGVLGDQYPSKKKDFKRLAKKISYSRRVAHAHYKSDSKFGELLGKSMYKHIKNKQS